MPLLGLEMEMDILRNGREENPRLENDGLWMTRRAGFPEMDKPGFHVSSLCAFAGCVQVKDASPHGCVLLT